MSTNESPHQLVGKVVFWSGAYGFIRVTGGNSIFFHKSDIVNTNDVYKMKVFYDVRFKKSFSTQPKHIGKPYAKDVNIVKKNKVYAKNKKGFEDIDLYLGVISNMDYTNTSGYIKSPQFEKEIKFFQTRNIFKKKFLKIGDVVVFNPVKSSENIYNIFAFIAYHADHEQNIDFLKSQAIQGQDPVIKTYVAKRILKANPTTTPEEEFEAKLLEIDFDADESNSYNALKGIIEFQPRSFFPEFTLLEKHCPDEFLIRLFLENIIDQYDPDLLYHYFKGTYADTKRQIIKRLNEEAKISFLREYYYQLRDKNILSRPSNYTKLLLDLTYRNETTKCDSLYSEIKAYLIKHLKPNELIELWLYNYIDSLSENFWKANFDKDEPIITDAFLKSKNNALYDLLDRLLEGYLFQIDNLCLHFDIEHPKYIRRLLIYEKILKKPIDKLEQALKVKLDDSQILTLWVFGVDFAVDLQNALDNSHKLSEYYRIRFFLRYRELTALAESEIPVKINITQAGLIHFIKSYEWNQLVEPVIPKSLKSTGQRRSIQFSFIDDIIVFANLNIADGLDANELAISLFHSIKYYSVYHLRLWLYELVENDFFNYTGFRTVFKELTSEEQYNFRKKANDIQQHEEIKKIKIEEVIPCRNIIEDSGSTRIYKAYIENIYFGYNQIMLRKEDKQYTKYYKMDGISPGFNRIPSNHSLNKMAIIIDVDIESNEIIKVYGLEEIFANIHINEIREALGTVSDNFMGISGRQAYAEDWELRKSIRNYLEVNHSKSFQQKLIEEPYNPFRRLDEHSGTDDYYLNILFTIDMSDGYAIVWENIDISLDKATYVFRATDTDYEPKIKNIIEGISALAQFKSTLSNQRDNQEELLIFRRKYGFVGSVRKNRGVKGAFNKWRDRLEALANRSIPPYPSQEELEKLNDWIPYNPHSSKVGVSPPIKVGSVKTDDTGITPEGNTKPPSNTIKAEMKGLLDKLKNFNSSFLEGKNI